MYCIHCGAQIPEGEKNCLNCGKKTKTRPFKDAVAFIKQFSSVLISRLKSNTKSAIIALAVIDIVLITVCISLFIPKAKPEEIALDYANAQYQSGITETTKYSVVDGKEIIEDSFKVYCKENDLSKKQGFKNLENKYKKMFSDSELDAKVSVKKFDDVFKIRKEYQEKLNFKKYGDYEIKVNVVECKKLKISELKNKLKYFNERLENEVADTYNSPEDYIKLDNIKEGYTVDVKIQITGKKDSEKYSNTYIVVKHKGNYKVLAYS